MPSTGACAFRHALLKLILAQEALVTTLDGMNLFGCFLHALL